MNRDKSVDIKERRDEKLYSGIQSLAETIFT